MKWTYCVFLYHAIYVKNEGKYLGQSTKHIWKIDKERDKPTKT
jgi:hypothetical protein